MPSLGAGPFHGLAPFSEGDERTFFGRDAEKKFAEGLLASRDVMSPILVSGECGSGKTSFIQAALIPIARRQEYIPFYLELGDGWEHKLRDDLARYVGRPLEPNEETGQVLQRLATTRENPLMLVLDQLEQLTWIDPIDAQRLDEVVKAVSPATQNRPGGPPPAPTMVQLVFGVDRDNLHVLGKLEGLGSRIPDERRIIIERLSPQAAGGLIEQTVLAGGAYMEAGLPERIANELGEAGPVFPADVQRVCHAAVLEHALTVKAFDRAGGASVLGALYVERLAQLAGGWHSRRVLAVLAEPENPRTALDPDDITASAGLSSASTIRLLEQLVETGLVRAISIAGQPVRYSLSHPHLRQSIRDLVAPLSRGRARGRLALGRRRGLLRPLELITIWRYLGNSISDSDLTRFQRSRRVWILIAAAVLALPFVAYWMLYGKLAASSYLAQANDTAGTPRVVLRTGDPSLSFAFNWATPPFGRVERDTGVAVASLPDSLAKTLESTPFVGSLDSLEKGVPRWLKALLPLMSEVRRGAWLMLAGQREAGSELLLAATTEETGVQRLQAARLMVLLDRHSENTRRAVMNCLRKGQPATRVAALKLASQLAAGSMLEALQLASKDADGMIRLAAVEHSNKLAPKRSLPLLATWLVDGDVRVQRAATKAIGVVAKKEPIATFDALLRVRSGKGRAQLAPVAAELAKISRQVAHRAGKQLAAHLLALVRTERDPAMQAQLLVQIQGLRVPLDAKTVLAAVEPLLSARDLAVRGAAVALKARFGEPEEVMSTLLDLARTYRPRTAAAVMRAAAALGLGLVRGADPKARLKLLKVLLLDPSPTVRRQAVASLLVTGFKGTREVIKRIKAGSLTVGRAALKTVCSETSLKPAVATAVLGAAWAVKKGALRQQALGCAQSLARANPRLALWLAYQAAPAKNMAIRRGAASALALALARRGRALSSLTLFYLRDKTPEVRAAVLHAIAKRPPKSVSFMMRAVQKQSRAVEPAVRAATAQLAAIGKSAEILTSLLADDAVLVRRAAVIAAARLGKTTGQQRTALNKALARVISRSDARDALQALETAQRLDLRQPILQASSHPAATVRARALELSTDQTDTAALAKVLEVAQRDGSLELRLAALRAITAQSRRLGRRAVSLLERSTRSAEPGERWAAFNALSALKGDAAKAAVGLLEQRARHRSEEVRRLAVRALARLAATVEPAGLALLMGSRDPAHDVRHEARAGLAAFLGRKRSAKDLWKLLRTSSADSVQRRTAIAALALYGRQHDAKKHMRWIDRSSKGVAGSAAFSIKLGARLAVALTDSQEAPGEVLSFIYGW